jgi:predicted nucleic acid-binding protein
MLLVDTNVIVDVLEDDRQWAAWSIDQLRAQSRIHALGINAIVYAELAMAFDAIEGLDQVIERMRLQMVEIPRPALFLAGKAFLRYRRQHGSKTSVLSDFYIGAHAAVEGVALLTRDVHRYRTYFPSVELIGPLRPEASP